jgi:hypothetical protein
MQHTALLLHFRDANGFTRDEEGYDLPDLAAVQWEPVPTLVDQALLQSRPNGYPV